jgi:hypothetical protein
VTVERARIAGPDPDPFLLSTDECTGAVLAPGAECRLGTVLVPDAEGAFAAQVEVEASDGTTDSLVALAGVGAPRPRKLVFADDFEVGSLAHWAVVEPPELDVPVGLDAPRATARLDRLAQGTEEARTVRLHNRGDVPLALGRLRLLATHGGRFALQDDGCSGATLPPGGTCSLRLSARLQVARGRVEIEVAGGGEPVVLVLEAGRKAPEARR